MLIKALLCVVLAVLAVSVANARDDWPPPRGYDHAFHGKVIVRHVYIDEPHTLAYTYGDTGGFCVVYVNTHPVVRIPLRYILRHEIGHCNGWEHR